MNIFTTDIVILLIILASIVGLWIGVLFAYHIFEEQIEKSKAKKCERRKISELAEGYYICPNCEGILNRKYKYCHKCGQALDWSDTE